MTNSSITADEIVEENKKVLDILMTAAFSDGCMCEVCRTKREYAASLVAYQVIYPELKVLPMAYSLLYNGGRLPRHCINMVRDLKRANGFISRAEQRKNKSKPLHFCNYCGTLVTAADSTKMKEHRYCKNCMGFLVQCHGCDEIVLRQNCYNGKVGNERVHICQSCRKNYRKCGGCDTLFPHKELNRIKSGRDQSGNATHYCLCGVCVDKMAVTCEGCGAVTYPTVGQSRGGHTYCPVCVEESKGICSYNYKPLVPRFRKARNEGKVTSKAFHMGFELEVAEHHPLIVRETVVQLVKEVVGRKNIYAMSDGSISQAANTDGAEFASHPFTWQYYKKQGYKHWDVLCLTLRKYGWKGNTPGLGIHIHTTKAAWGTHQIYKLLYFVEKNKRQVQKIAQRGPTIYNNYDYLNHDENLLTAKDKKQNGGDGHYQCINLNQGESGTAAKTIEFRMFQSTLEPLFFHKNVEFTYALWKFTQELSLKQMTWDEFDLYLTRHRRDYPCLTEFIKMKGIR